ncbi:MAG: tetratricopeptide repeat protein [Defluviitaleaceae bacterium]|nr:tetratricopeptide repeat protein [Defluviitaleaceae bacterium]MCL2239099.1 tetratricopeptide repeat protein [Defluviitaleaceae bacterium]
MAKGLPRRLIAFTGAILLAAIITATILLNNDTAQPEAPAFSLETAEGFLLALDFNQAHGQFAGVIANEPENIRAYLGAAEVYLHLGRRMDAIALLRGAFQATGSPSLAHALAGVELSPVQGFVAIVEAMQYEGLAAKARGALRRAHNTVGDALLALPP